MKSVLYKSDAFQLVYLLKQDQKTLIKFIIALILSSISGMSFPLAVSDMTSLCSPDISTSQILFKILKWSSVVSIGALASYFRRVYIQTLVISKQSHNLVFRMRSQFFEQLIQKKLASFQGVKSGSLSHNIGNDINQIASNITTDVSVLLRGIIYSICGMILLTYNVPNIMLFLLFPIIFLLISGRFFGRTVKAKRHQQAQSLRSMLSFSQQKISQIKTIKLFNAQQQEIERFRSKISDVYQKSMDITLLSSKLLSCLQFLVQNCAIIGIGYGSYIVCTQGFMELNELTAFGMYSLYTAIGFAMTSHGYTEIKKGAGVYKEIKKFISDKLQNQDVFLTGDLKNQLAASVEFKQVSYSYIGREVKVLNNISFQVSPGEVWGIIGQSGAGKSSLTHLLCKLFVPSEGKIYINGEDISLKSEWWVRKHIAVVSQESLLFSGTIRSNLEYSGKDLSLEELEFACKRADAFDFIMKLPQKLDTEVGENGYELSGGQRQRICIARALLKNPSILVLDEATSGLDGHSEQKIQGVIEREVKKGYTALVISHRVTSLKKFVDKVALLHEGSLVNVGTYEEVEKSEYFQLLSKVQ